MTQHTDVINDNNSPGSAPRDGIWMSITTKLVLSFLAVIIISGAIFTVVGILLISNHIQADAHGQATRDLASAQEVYLHRLDQLKNVVVTTASNNRIQDAITSNNMARVTDELLGVRFREGLDILTVTDSNGTVLLRASDLYSSGGNIGHEELIESVILSHDPMASTVTISNDDLRLESGLLADKALQAFSILRGSDSNPEGRDSDVMMMGASAPIFDSQGSLIGVVWAGSLLSTDSTLICEISKSVFSGEVDEGKHIGFATIYQDDLAILACPDQGDSTELVGTLLSDEEYDQVVEFGEPWIGRDRVVDNTYITAYEPIRNSDNEIVGILQHRRLHSGYVDWGIGRHALCLLYCSANLRSDKGACIGVEQPGPW